LNDYPISSSVGGRLFENLSFEHASLDEKVLYFPTMVFELHVRSSSLDPEGAGNNVVSSMSTPRKWFPAKLG